MMRTRRLFFVALLSLIALSAVFAPFHAAYADDLSNTIVPNCQAETSGPYAGFSGACQLCDLVTLARNIINFAVAFSVIVATLMFTYAGVLYFTASAKADNIKKAHSIFVNVLVGLVIILVAWLVIDLIMRSLVGQRITAGSFGPWNSFQCSDYPVGDRLQNVQTPTVSAGGGGGGGGGGSGAGVQGVTSQMESDARLALTSQSNGHICISASGSSSCDAPPCTAALTTGCTSVGGLTTATRQNLVTITQHCNCTLTLTGGSEGGHSSGGQHNSGNAVDLRWDTSTAQFLHDSYANGNPYHIYQICTTAADAQYRVGPSCTESVQQIHVGFGG